MAPRPLKGLNDSELARLIYRFEGPDFSPYVSAMSLGEAQEVARFLIKKWADKLLTGVSISDALEEVRRVQL